MPSFPKPQFEYDYQIASQIEAVRQYRDQAPGRQIPARQPNRLLLATWNIANLGLQQRREKDYRLIAEILSWFDLIAVQEVHDNTAGIRGIHQHLPAAYRLLFSDIAGNKERMAFVYDATKVAQLEKVGEVSVPPADFSQIKLPGIQRKFDGFDRNPYLHRRVPGGGLSVSGRQCAPVLRLGETGGHRAALAGDIRRRALVRSAAQEQIRLFLGHHRDRGLQSSQDRSRRRDL